jgi:predicted small metal-binding protein
VSKVTKIIRCSCGYVVRADTDDRLVADAQRHAREVHNLAVTKEQVLAMAEIASEARP